MGVRLCEEGVLRQAVLQRSVDNGERTAVLLGAALLRFGRCDTRLVAVVETTGGTLQIVVFLVKRISCDDIDLGQSHVAENARLTSKLDENTLRRVASQEFPGCSFHGFYVSQQTAADPSFLPGLPLTEQETALALPAVLSAG